ncbi:MAG: tRNA (adenosine(37)-N6)-dimethylallyltransferase MiaA [Planctomycetota bacterium]
MMSPRQTILEHPRRSISSRHAVSASVFEWMSEMKAIMQRGRQGSGALFPLQNRFGYLRRSVTEPAPFLVLTGPTAAGKTEIATEVARRLGAEILCMDSMTVYRGMDIGTAKPSPSERAVVPHHLLDLVDPREEFDTARWCRAAEEVSSGLLARGGTPLFVGGTPLYLMAFFKGMMAAPAADPELRARIEAREDAEPGVLHRELSRADPAAARRIHWKDRRRLVRALEVIERTGTPISEQQSHFERPGWARPCRILALFRDREELHRRVKRRTEKMLEAGLLDEVRSILDRGGFSRTAAAAIGYAESLDYLRGRYKDLEELRNKIRRHTHRLIRRQTTWLRRLEGVRWLCADATPEAVIEALCCDRPS